MTCAGNGRSANSRVEWRCCRARISGIPPVRRGGGSGIGSCTPCATIGRAATVAPATTIPVLLRKSRRVTVPVCCRYFSPREMVATWPSLNAHDPDDLPFSETVQTNLSSAGRFVH